jgi:hypothetical protein
VCVFVCVERGGGKGHCRGASGPPEELHSSRYDDAAIVPFNPPGVSPTVVDLVRRMLRWDPAARPDLVEVINVLFSPEHM